MEAWADRTATLSAMDGVDQVYCFENRGEEIGVTLHHPHGQIYRVPVRDAAHPADGCAGRSYAAQAANLFDDLVAAEQAERTRMVAANDQWLAFVPPAARWPYEVLIFPTRGSRPRGAGRRGPRGV